MNPGRSLDIDEWWTSSGLLLSTQAWCTNVTYGVLPLGWSEQTVVLSGGRWLNNKYNDAISRIHFVHINKYFIIKIFCKILNNRDFDHNIDNLQWKRPLVKKNIRQICIINYYRTLIITPNSLYRTKVKAYLVSLTHWNTVTLKLLFCMG